MLLLLYLGCQQYEGQIVPVHPTTIDDLQLYVLDKNGDKVPKNGVSWYREKQLVAQGSTLLAEHTKKGENWIAVAILEDSSEIQSTIVIENTPPTIDSINLKPSNPMQGYQMSCSVETADIDEDLVGYTCDWTSPTGHTLTATELDGEDVVLGEWTCTVTISDGDNSVAESVSTTVVELTEIPDSENLLQNSSFESGNFNDWEYENCSVVDMVELQGVLGPWPFQVDPYEGNWMLSGGDDHCRAWQELDLLSLNYFEPHIDSVRLRIQAEAYLANKGNSDNYDDQVKLILYFLDDAGEQLSQMESLFAGGGDWVFRDVQRMIPMGTRTVIAEINADWRSDNMNDSFADDVSINIQLASKGEPELINSPMLIDHRQEAMKITWETNGVDHDPVVFWGDALENAETNIRSTWLDEEHVVHIAELTGFTASQVVNYQVGIDGLGGAQFKTAPEYGEDFSMAWLADNQEGYERFSTHVGNISARDPDLMFVVGDLVQTCSVLEEWQQMWWEPLQENNFAQYTPVLAARGNHDMEHPYAYANVDLPENGAWYSFLYGDVYFLVLNTHANMFATADDLPDGQFDYIEDQLSSVEAQQAAFRIVAFHQAPFSNSSQTSSPQQIIGNENARIHWVPLFEQYAVDVVISGHYHSYQRGEYNGIVYLVVGGGGSTLLIQEENNWDWLDLNLSYQYSMMHREENQLRWEIYDLNDQLIDSFMVR